MYPILEQYISSCPDARPTDLIKFCYQSVMGPGHMAPSLEKAESRLEAELELMGLPDGSTPLVQPLEGDAARLDVGCGLSPHSLAALFCMTADGWARSDNWQDEIMAMLSDPGVRAAMPFSGEELDKAIAAWQADGCPAVSHSDEYKAKNRAAYRLVNKAFLPYIDAIKAIENMPKPAVVAIDGMCGSGKSTLARVLREIFTAQVVRMDDFFLPFEMKTPERLSQPGGNVHYERFNEEVAPKLGEGFEYRRFDCSVGRLNGAVSVKKADITIVEGSYCQSPDVKACYDLKIFVETDPLTQMARIEARDPDMADNFRERWIPMEEHYFKSFGIRDKADIIVRT